MGRNSEAIAEMRKAENLDPLSLIINADLAELLLIARFSDQSIQQSRKTIGMDPNFAVAHYDLGQALLQKHIYGEAIAELEAATKPSADSPICNSTLAYAYAVPGRRNEALKILNDLTRQSKDFSSAAAIALIYTGLGENDRAMAWLKKGLFRAQPFHPLAAGLRPSALRSTFPKTGAQYWTSAVNLKARSPSTSDRWPANPTSTTCPPAAGSIKRSIG